MTAQHLHYKFEDTELGRSYLGVYLTGDQVGIEQGAEDDYDVYVDIVYIKPEELSDVITALIKAKAMIEEGQVE